MHAIPKIPGFEPGVAVAILATGASLTPEVAEGARKYPCVAVSDAYLRAPWASALYAHDAQFWECAAGARDFQGMKISGQPSPYVDATVPAKDEKVTVRPGTEYEMKNSGVAAIRLVAAQRPREIHLYGFDCAPGHFHKEHRPPRSPPDPGVYAMWAVMLENLIDELGTGGIRVVRHGGYRPPVLVEGMNGFGDCIHQRGIIRPLARRREVWLRTPWPQLYQDIPGVRCIRRNSTKRNAAANEARSLFAPEADVPRIASVKSLGYWPASVRTHGSVLKAMGAAAGVEPGSMEFAPPASWCDAARDRLPLGVPRNARFVVYRPLVERAEAPTPSRLPDPATYATLFERVRRTGLYVVSVANLAPGHEERVGPAEAADVHFDAGELSTEELIGLFAEAEMVYTSPGFATVLGQAVRTPTITVFGGFEDDKSFAGGAWPGWLPILPKKPCPCWNPAHACDKAILVDAAAEAIDRFLLLEVGS